VRRLIEVKPVHITVPSAAQAVILSKGDLGSM
jgi:hypothetical protein